ncbi:loricrin, putative [Trichomonas vaginalis G3]|uniref:receptor protein-tyrosine kinase n=1 Tax=Trichomonas vaginalis (strain ATCC PRA-98 / G3) TaxID=412133 RepID=A2DWQ5_TRIV3|nr:glycine-rich protein family [Trichomonas vaginalis G3]EAY15087.1 loricrin, putative [Trichomonas vaginalis G3]KAI5499231.1 glycine-rich protein family [Trichomonas vaginalis G3]|eukprot:XP_001327310.1 loricrin [Trichomonas vaginalis G3]
MPVKEIKRFVALGQTFEYVFYPGLYFVESYGPSGGGDGHGSYVSGIVGINTAIKVYVTLGGKGQTGKFDGSITPGGVNGGGNGGRGSLYKGSMTISGGSGGGRTVISLNSDQTSPVIVSGGGGGGVMTSAQYQFFSFVWGDAGGIRSNDASFQTYSYVHGVSQSFRIENGSGQNGRNGIDNTDLFAEGSGGGGAGYRGGLAPQDAGTITPGSGGSSYISGHQDCEIEKRFVFTKCILKNGTETQYDGDGYVIISRITLTESSCLILFYQRSIYFLFLFILG